MPKKMELALKRTAKKIFGSVKSKKAKSYVFGTMNKLGKLKGGK